MLFNSYEFIFLFLIPVYVVFTLLRRKEVQFGTLLWFLTVVSVVFYAQWSLKHLIILLSSIMMNFMAAKLMMSYQKYRREVLSGGIVLNLLPLLYYKYAAYLEGSEAASIVLPLAISFFTFQQIAFLVDVFKEKITLESFREYSFFVLFFPQLVAGPIVHYNELVPQTQTKEWLRFNEGFFNKGLVLFSIGLFKKVVLADNLANIANASFTEKLNSFYDAWLGLFAYTFEIYFDFSGYTDMAIGLALLFGIQLPINFNSPYKSRNIVEFWRRWHITLSHFLRDYIYIPLGGSKKGRIKTVFNLFITMLLGGIWHGVGWNFLIWGALHGVALAVVHSLKRDMPKYLAGSVTFLTVSLLWVFFRSENFPAALHYYGVLFDFSERDSFVFQDSFLLFIPAAVTVWFLPNSMEFIKFRDASVMLRWYHAFITGILFFISLKMMACAPAKTFVYFNF